MPFEGRHEEASPRREEPPATDRRARRPPVASSRDESPLSSPPSSTTAVSPRNAAPRCDARNFFKEMFPGNFPRSDFFCPVRLCDRKNEWSCEKRIAVLRKSRRLFLLVTGGRKKWTQQDPFLETQEKEQLRAAGCKRSRPGAEEAEVADAHPRPPAPRTGRRARSRFAEKGPSGAWTTPSGGGGSKRNGRSPRRWIEWEKDE